MIRYYAMACALFLLSCSTAAVWAAGPADQACQHPQQIAAVANTLSDVSIGQLRALQAEYYLDHAGDMGPDRIGTATFAPANCAGIFHAPLPGQSVWLRFALRNSFPEQQRWVVTFIEANFDEVVLFEDQSGSLTERARTGQTVPFEVRDNAEFNTGFPIVLEPGEELLLYLRIAGTFEPTITAVLMSDELFFDWSTLIMTIRALFLCYVGLFAVISLIIFRQIHVRYYQYYTLYMLCQFAFSFIFNGWLNKYFGVTLPVTTLMPISEFFAGLSVFVNIQYCRILLNAGADTRAWRWFFVTLSGIALGATALAVLDPWRLSTPLHLLYFVCPLALLVFAIRKIREGLPQAWPIAGSLLSLSLGLAIAVFAFMVPINITEANFAYELVLMRPLIWGYYLAILGETLFMMVAISTMVRALQKERLSAVDELASMERQLEDIRHEQRAAEKATTARLEALENVLRGDPETRHHLSAKRQFLDRITECVLDSVADQSLGVEKLASMLAISQKTLGRRLKEANGQSPASFIRSVRLNFARNLILLDKYNTVAEIAHASGFSSVSNFAKLYREEFGEAPSKSISLLRKIQ
ncbi:hypothetical protein So717_25900 [Roseobacter cerasinus]|uniref:HTH araC/xylS-type domain-containing protein n=2 Tax=Roseobacter cerasinus TaxID=2602289 RepID=A0A640VSQ5_9RHOB|nr:hypothetical protein So717_25900 [Roseobacter cerasinus]